MATDIRALSRKYARAFLDVVVELRGEEVAKKFTQSLRTFSVLESPEIYRFFANPVFDRGEKLAVLETLAKKQKLDPLIHRFLQQVISLGHVTLLDEIADAYGDALRERENQIRGRLRTAFPLSKKDQERIVKGLSRATGKEVLLEISEDKELIGGVVAEVGSVVYDASIKNYLTRLEQEF